MVFRHSVRKAVAEVELRRMPAPLAARRARLYRSYASDGTLSLRATSSPGDAPPGRCDAFWMTPEGKYRKIFENSLKQGAAWSTFN
jgi:hypothetical protein